MYPIYVQDLRQKALFLVYRGWDLDHDGHIDMLEILDEKGKIKKVAYDFDFDGKVDVVAKENK